MIYRRMFGVPSWSVQNPFHELENLRQRLNQIVNRTSADGFPDLHAGVFPTINLTEDRENYYVRAELPGIGTGDIEIEATGNNISISGERKIPAEDADVKYHRREREAGKFSRAIALPGEIDSDRVQAKLSDGILKLTVAKAEKAKPKQIAIH